jgi:hypothetical protein
MNLLRATSPNGPDFASAIFRLLEREQFWKTWKANGCKPFEKEIPDEEYTTFNLSAPSDRPKTGTTEQTSSLPLGMEEKKESGPIQWSVGSTLSRNLTQRCKDFVETSTPSLERFTGTIKDIADPNDPFSTEAEKAEEIDGLRKDKRFLWRGTRLMSEQNLSSIEKIPQTNLVDLVADVYNIELPQKAQEQANSTSEGTSADATLTSGTTEGTKTSVSVNETSAVSSTPTDTVNNTEQSESGSGKRHRPEEAENGSESDHPKKQARAE